jgi:hypothetical protein
VRWWLVHSSLSEEVTEINVLIFTLVMRPLIASILRLIAILRTSNWFVRAMTEASDTSLCVIPLVYTPPPAAHRFRLLIWWVYQKHECISHLPPSNMCFRVYVFPSSGISHQPNIKSKQLCGKAKKLHHKVKKSMLRMYTMLLS